MYISISSIHVYIHTYTSFWSARNVKTMLSEKAGLRAVASVYMYIYVRTGIHVESYIYVYTHMYGSHEVVGLRAASRRCSSRQRPIVTRTHDEISRWS